MLHFHEWLKLREEGGKCGTMGCPGAANKPDDTPQGRAAKIYPRYKNPRYEGCSGTSKPCANQPSAGGGGGAAPAPGGPAPKMKKK